MRGERLAWLHCFAGVAGDMLLGACLDAGADLCAVRAVLDSLDVPGLQLEAETVLRGGIAATQAVVTVTDAAPQLRTLGEVLACLDGARLPGAVRAQATAVFSALAEAEAQVHGTSAEAVHFHEVGALDAIADVVGVCAALADLGVGRLVASPIATGVGATVGAHGVLPVPAPAVVALLRDVPIVGRDVGVELTTPTGAALVRTLAHDFGPVPAMVVRATGFGAGTRDPDGLPNVVQLVIGDPATEEPSTAGGEPLVVLDTNLDDVTGEVLAHAQARLLEQGALDAWLTPITMKKGRPGVQVSVLCREVDRTRLQEVLVAETGTLGVRAHIVDRWSASRRLGVVDVDGAEVGVKIARSRVKAEFADAAGAASSLGVPVREVARRAQEAAESPKE